MTNKPFAYSAIIFNQFHRAESTRNLFDLPETDILLRFKVGQYRKCINIQLHMRWEQNSTRIFTKWMKMP